MGLTAHTQHLADQEVYWTVRMQKLTKVHRKPKREREREMERKFLSVSMVVMWA